MAACGSWWSWLRQELSWNRKLVPLKVLLFFYSGGTSSILPYLGVHMRQLGLTLRDIAVISAVLPIANIVGPPVAGMFADKTGQYKLTVFFSLVLCIIFHLSLLLVPTRPLHALSLPCTHHQHLITPPSCHPCHRSDNDTVAIIQLESCRPSCNASREHFQVCRDNHTASDRCQAFPWDTQVRVEAGLGAWRGDDTCGHSWTSLRVDDAYFDALQCPVDCHVQCMATTTVPGCADEQDTTTFWLYLALRMMATMCMAALFTMMDALTLAAAAQHGGEYGKQRFMFIAGLATMPLLAGYLADWRHAVTGVRDYGPAIYFGSALTLLSGILLFYVQCTVEKAPGGILKNMRRLVGSCDINIYFVMLLGLGSNWGFIESFLFIYLETMGAPAYLMSLTMTVGSAVGLPVMLVADKVVDKMGRHTVFLISFIAYAVRHMGYSFIRNPWLVFVFEVLEVFTYQLTWVAAMNFCHVLAPKGTLATLTALTGTIHFSLGRGLGSLVGGYLIAAMSFPAAFRTFAGMAAALALLYLALYFAYFRKNQPADVIRVDSEDPDFPDSLAMHHQKPASGLD